MQDRRGRAEPLEEAKHKVLEGERISLIHPSHGFHCNLNQFLRKSNLSEEHADRFMRCSSWGASGTYSRHGLVLESA
jgi:hypothetical protein